MTELEKRTAKGKSMFATFKQCARYLSPLFEFCRKKVRIFWCSVSWLLKLYDVIFIQLQIKVIVQDWGELGFEMMLAMT